MSPLKKIIFLLIPLAITCFLIEGITRICKPERTKTFWFTPPGTKIVLPPYEYHTSTQNIDKGVRRTVGFRQGSGLPFAGMIWVFGGSTTYCSEVADNVTWPSILQQYVNEQVPNASFEIINFGVTTINSYQELERLRLELTKDTPPVLCIFFDGVNDVIQGVTYNNPEGTLFETAKEREQRLVPKIRHWSAFLDVAIGKLAPLISRVPNHIKEPDILDKLATRTAANYEDNIRAAAELCNLHRVRFIVFLQPCLYSIRRTLTQQEVELFTADPSVVLNQNSFAATYPLMRTTVNRLALDGLMAYDLTGIFDATQEPILLDTCHVGTVGNEIIAKNVAEVIRPSLVEAAAKVGDADGVREVRQILR